MYNISLRLLSPPPPRSSRNRSGSGSCGSMEIWVRAVYVIAASINALLICLGLQSSIRIIHLRAHVRPPARTLKTDARQGKNADLLTARELERAERKSGGQHAASLLVLGLGIVTVSICSAHRRIYIRATPNNAGSAKNKPKKPDLDRCRDLLITTSHLFVSRPVTLGGKTELRPPKVEPDLVYFLCVFFFFLYLLSVTINCACCVTHLSGLLLVITPPDGVISAVS